MCWSNDTPLLYHLYMVIMEAVSTAGPGGPPDRVTVRRLPVHTLTRESESESDRIWTRRTGTG